MDRQDRTNSRKTIFSVTSCPEMPPSADPVLQVIRLFDSTGRLQEDVATCLDKEEFLLVHRPFKQGRDCACDAEKHRHEAPPTADNWHSAYSQLETDTHGRKILCNACGHIDDELTHVPPLVNKLGMGLAFPEAKSASACTSLVKKIFAIVGLDVTAISPDSYGRWYDRASRRLGGRDPEGLSLDVSEQHAEGPISTLTPVNELLKVDISKQVPFAGNTRYCRLPDGYLEAMAGLSVVVKAEEELLRVFREEAAKLDALVDKDQDETSPEPFVKGIDFTERGWATSCFERSEKLFAKDPVKPKAVKDIVEGMVTLLNDTVIEPERMLGGDVAKALRQQWSMEAVATPARKDRPSILRDAFERVGEASKEPGGLKRFFDDHIPRLMLSFQSIATQRDGEVARAKKVSDELLERRKSLLAKGLKCTLTPRDIELATRPICLRSTFNITRPQIRRSGRGWVNGLPHKTKQATGGSAGRKLGSAQYSRPPDSTPSETGFSFQTIHGARVYVAECPADPDCLAVFTGAQLVNKNMGSHLRIAHGYTADQLENEFALHHFKCPCGDPSHVGEGDGEVIPTDPNTVFSHLRKAREPSEEDRTRMERWASVADSVRGLAKMAEEMEALGVLLPTEEQEAACLQMAHDILAKILSVSSASLTTTVFNQSPRSSRARGSTATNRPSVTSPRRGSIRSPTRPVGNAHSRTPAGLWGGRPASSQQAKALTAGVASASAPSAPPAPAAATAQGEGAAAATAPPPAASTNSSTTTTSAEPHHKQKKQTNPQSPRSGRIIQKKLKVG